LRTALDTGLEASASLNASGLVSHISRAIIEDVAQAFERELRKHSPQIIQKLQEMTLDNSFRRTKLDLFKLIRSKMDTTYRAVERAVAVKHKILNELSYSSEELGVIDRELEELIQEAQQL
jgi:hypothetical protein